MRRVEVTCPGSCCNTQVSLVLTSLPGCFREWKIGEFGLAIKDPDSPVTWGRQFSPRTCVVVGLESERPAHGFPEEFIPFLDQSIPASLALKPSKAQDLGRGDEMKGAL